MSCISKLMLTKTPLKDLRNIETRRSFEGL